MAGALSKSLVSGIVIAAAVAAMVAPTPADHQPSLAEAAGRLGLLVGAAVDPAHFSEPDYAETLAREFNMVEPENVMKWRHIEPARGHFDFGAWDQVVSFAAAHQMKVRGHNLLWPARNPAWVTDGHFTPAELREILHEHIATVAGHYGGKVFAWDVVNEAFDSRGRLRHSVWYDEPGIGLAGRGTAYVEQAFRWAREADPKALLFYNDYAAEGLNAKSDAIYTMVRDFKRCGVPIDGVGLQMHVAVGSPEGISVLTSLDANITRLARLGVQVQITEMDVSLPLPEGQTSEPPADSPEVRQQAGLYGRVAAICAGNPGCTAFQTWGVTDRYSWIPVFTHGKRGSGLLFDNDYRPKPCYQAVLKALMDAWR